MFIITNSNSSAYRGLKRPLEIVDYMKIISTSFLQKKQNIAQMNQPSFILLPKINRKLALDT